MELVQKWSPYIMSLNRQPDGSASVFTNHYRLTENDQLAWDRTMLAPTTNKPQRYEFSVEPYEGSFANSLNDQRCAPVAASHLVFAINKSRRRN